MSIDSVASLDDSPAYHHGNLRKALVDAAIEILKEDGVHKAGLRSVARKVGVSQAAPYSHFKDKEDLLAAVSERGFSAMAKAMEFEAMGTLTERERLLALARGYIKFAVQEKSLFQLMFSSEGSLLASNLELALAKKSCRELLLNSLAEELQLTDNQEIKLATAELALWSSIHGLATLIVQGDADFFNDNISEVDELVTEVTSCLRMFE